MVRKAGRAALNFGARGGAETPCAVVRKAGRVSPLNLYGVGPCPSSSPPFRDPIRGAFGFDYLGPGPGPGHGHGASGDEEEEAYCSWHFSVGPVGVACFGENQAAAAVAEH